MRLYTSMARVHMHRLIAALDQGLTLVHFLAQCKSFLRDKGCMQGLFRGSLGGNRGFPEGIRGVFNV